VLDEKLQQFDPHQLPFIGQPVQQMLVPKIGVNDLYVLNVFQDARHDIRRYRSRTESYDYLQHKVLLSVASDDLLLFGYRVVPLPKIDLKRDLNNIFHGSGLKRFLFDELVPALKSGSEISLSHSNLFSFFSGLLHYEPMITSLDYESMGDVLFTLNVNLTTSRNPMPLTLYVRADQASAQSGAPAPEPGLVIAYRYRYTLYYTIST